MRKKDIKNRIKLIEDQLTLVTQIRREEFLEVWGSKGIEAFVNERLEEYLYLTNLLKKLNEEDENSKTK